MALTNKAFITINIDMIELTSQLKRKAGQLPLSNKNLPCYKLQLCQWNYKIIISHFLGLQDNDSENRVADIRVNKLSI